MRILSLTLVQQTAVQAPPNVVWAVFSDLRRWPEWNRVCLHAEERSGSPWSPGFRFHMVLRMAGRSVPFTPVVIEVTPASSVVWASTRFTITGRRTFRFDPLGEGGTLVTDEKHFSSPVVPVRLVYPRQVISNMSAGWLESLKAEAERRRAAQA